MNDAWYQILQASVPSVNIELLMLLFTTSMVCFSERMLYLITVVLWSCLNNDFCFLLWFVADTLVHHNGYGFVQFASEEEGRQAVEAENGTMFHGKKISEYDWNKHFSGACTDITGLPLAAVSFPLHTGLSQASTLPRNNLLEWISKSAHSCCCPVNVRDNTG